MSESAPKKSANAALDNPKSLIVCPCGRACRTGRKLGVGSKVRCPDCKAVNSVFIHANGAIELRPLPETSLRDLVDVESTAGLGLPPRVSEQAEPIKRRSFGNYRRKDAAGGYGTGIEKSRSWFSGFAVIGAVGLGTLLVSLYWSKIDQIVHDRGKGSANVWKSYDDGKHEDFLKRQEEVLKKQKPFVKSLLVPEHPMQ